MKETMLSPEELSIDCYFISMNKFSIIFFLILAASTLLTACGPTNNVPIIPLKADEMQADVSGFGSFSATNTTAKVGNSTVYVHASIQDVTGTDSVVLELNFPKAIAFANVSDGVSYINYCITQSNGQCLNYHADNTSGSGRINVTSLSPNVEGTFSGTLTLVSGSTSITISNGAFDAVIIP
jgi:hypothetical protein